MEPADEEEGKNWSCAGDEHGYFVSTSSTPRPLCPRTEQGRKMQEKLDQADRAGYCVVQTVILTFRDTACSAGGAAFAKCSKIPVILNGDFTCMWSPSPVWFGPHFRLVVPSLDGC